MSSNVFIRIAEEAIRKAERVPCDLEEFHVGLAEMWHVLNERCEAEGVDPRQMAREGKLSDE